MLPKGVWLTSIAGAAGAAAAGEHTGTPRLRRRARVRSPPPRRPGSVPTFNLSGCAASQAQVALALDRLRLIDGVSAVTLQASGGVDCGGGHDGRLQDELHGGAHL